MLYTLNFDTLNSKNHLKTLHFIQFGYIKGKPIRACIDINDFYKSFQPANAFHTLLRMEITNETSHT